MNATLLMGIGIGILSALLSGAVSVKSEAPRLQARTHSAPGLGSSSAIHYSSVGFYSSYISYSASSLPVLASRSYYSVPASSFDPDSSESVHEMTSPPLVTTTMPTHNIESASPSVVHTTVYSTLAMQDLQGSGEQIGSAANTTSMSGGVPLKEACGALVMAMGLINVFVLRY